MKGRRLAFDEMYLFLRMLGHAAALFNAVAVRRNRAEVHRWSTRVLAREIGIDGVLPHQREHSGLAYSRHARTAGPRM